MTLINIRLCLSVTSITLIFAQRDPLPNLFDRFTESLSPMGVVPDTNKFLGEYDFIIIGSGSGGSVLANRLTEIDNWNVLLLEAGMEENSMTDVPLAAASAFVTRNKITKMLSDYLIRNN